MKSLFLESAPPKKKPTKKAWKAKSVLKRATMGIKMAKSNSKKKQETATMKRSRSSEPFRIYY